MIASIILADTMTTDIFSKFAKETSRILLFLESNMFNCFRNHVVDYNYCGISSFKQKANQQNYEGHCKITVTSEPKQEGPKQSDELYYNFQLSIES